MCAKKKANLDFWLTVWLSFERRKIFLETVLKMLLIYVFPTLAIRLQVGDVLKLALLAWSRTLDLKGAGFFLVFLSCRHQHAFCFRRIQCHPISTTPSRDII